MNAIPKTKLCWNCEARVTPYDENCPYCCVYLNPIPKPKNEQDIPSFSHFIEEEKDQIPTPLYASAETTFDEAKTEETSSSSPAKTTLYSIILLLTGSMLLFFAVALFLFSVDGTLTLRWNSTYWYGYLLAALPLILLGWRTLLSIDD